MSDVQITVIAGISLYIGVMLFIGWWASRKINNTGDYIVAGGTLGWPLLTGTLFATWFGAETCMGSSATAYEEGILGVIADPFGAGLCLIISGLFFAKHFRSMNIKTIVDYFEIRYSKNAAWFLGVIYTPVYLGWIGAQLLAFGTILNQLTGLPQMPCIIAATVVVLVYTYQGGMLADTVTDMVQMIGIILGLLILFPILIKDLGGWEKAVASAPEGFFNFYPSSHQPLDWFNYLESWLIVGLGSLPAQDLFARTMAARSPKLAQNASVISGILYMIIGLIPVMLGIFGKAVIPVTGDDSILIALALKYLSPVMIAIMVGALLSAIMSSADSALLAPSAIIGQNIVPAIKPDASEELKLKWCKWSVPVIGFLSLGLALYFQDIYTLCQEAWGILLAGVAAPMIAGVYWKKADAFSAAAGAAAGIISWVCLKAFSPENLPHCLIGFMISFSVLIICSLMPDKVTCSNKFDPGSSSERNFPEEPTPA